MTTGNRRATPPARPATRGVEQEVFLAIQKAADELMADLAELLKPHGVSPTQYNVLRILRGAGAGRREGGHPDVGGGGLGCREIGQRMLTRDPDITRLLDRLEGRGLIARERGREDRRRVSSRITDAGLTLLRGLDEPVLRLHRDQLGRLGAAKLARLLDLLQDLRAGRDACSEAPDEA